MEVEVKLWFPDAQAMHALQEVLGGQPTKVYHQTNVYFDTVDSKLSDCQAVLRLRFFEDEGTERCVLTLKEGGVMRQGIMVTGEKEQDIQVAEGRKCQEDPHLIAALGGEVVQHLVDTFGDRFVCLGSIENHRSCFPFEGLTLEVDHTVYPFGEQFGVELETLHPEDMKEKLTSLLKEHSIPFSEATKSKFAIFREGTLP